MKRKSEDLSNSTHSLSLRNQRKNKTLGFTAPAQAPDQPYSKHSELVISKLIAQIVEAAHNRIKVRAHECLIDSLVLSCQSMAANLTNTICPELHENQNNFVVIDREPDRVAFDPICGFDKLVTMRNQTVGKPQDNSMLESKSRPFGVFQSGKKQQSNLKSMTLISKLIPLDSLNLTQTKSEKQSEKQESFYRDRIYDNGLPMLVVPEYRKPQKTKTSKLGFENSKPSEDCVFDYNGQKNTLSAFSKLSSITAPKQNSSNVLRTTYRLVDPINLNQERKKISLSKNRNSRGSNLMELYRVNKEIIKNPNLKNDKSELDNSILKFDGNWDQSEVVKGILEASFRERDIVFRPIEKTQRKSKIL